MNKEQRPIRSTVWICLVATALIVAGALVWSFWKPQQPEPPGGMSADAKPPAPESPPPEDSRTPQSSPPNEEPQAPPPPPGENPSGPEDTNFAIPSTTNPMNVVIPWNPELGEISVEEYSRDGKPTGRRLKRGTQVEIPDPNAPGERIIFRVP